MMQFQDVNESISFTITINVVIATAINYFMDASTFTDAFAELIARFYGISIISLIFSYIFLQLINSYSKEGYFEESYFKFLHRFLILNLFFSNLLLLLISYPTIINFKYGLQLIIICISFNIGMPVFCSVLLLIIIICLFAIKLYMQIKKLMT